MTLAGSYGGQMRMPCTQGKARGYARAPIEGEELAQKAHANIADLSGDHYAHSRLRYIQMPVT